MDDKNLISEQDLLEFEKTLNKLTESFYELFQEETIEFKDNIVPLHPHFHNEFLFDELILQNIS
jgi:hypothetical protein